MGIQWLGITTTITMLKSIFFVAALVAAVYAEADADADAYYSTLGYHGLGYTNYGLRSYAAPYAFGVRSYGYAGPYTYGAYRHFGKRSADAEPEADADADAYYSTLGYHGLGYANYGYNGYRSYVAPTYTRSFGYPPPTPTTMVPTGTLARGLLMLSLRPRLMLMLMLTTAPLATMVWDMPTTDTTDTGPMLPLPTPGLLATPPPTPTTMVPTGTSARGPLMLSLRPRLMLML